jgi:hypothetical protein
MRPTSHADGRYQTTRVPLFCLPGGLILPNSPKISLRLIAPLAASCSKEHSSNGG